MLFRRAKAHAALRGVTLKALITESLEKGLRREEGSSAPVRRRKRSPLPVAAHVKGRRIGPFSNAALFALLDEEDAKRARRG